MIRPQSDDYHHLQITNSNTKAPLTAYTIDIEGNLTISGTAVLSVSVRPNPITIAGNWVNYATGGFTEGTTSVTFDGVTQAITCTAGTENFFDVTFSGTGTVTANPHLDIANDIVISGTAVLAPAAGNNIFVFDDWTNYGTAGFTEGTSHVQFDGTGAQVMTNTAGTENFYDVTFTTSGTTTANPHLDIANDIVISGTAVLAPAAGNNIYVFDDWTNYGTAGFTEGTSNVQFDGTGAQVITNTVGTENFYNVTFTTSGTTTANPHLDIANDIVISGTAVLAPAATRNIYVFDDWTN